LARESDAGEPPAGWRTATALSYGVVIVVVAAFLALVLLGAAVYVFLRELGPDEGKAKQEVARYLTRRFPDRAVDVRRCDFLPGDSESDSYECVVRNTYERRVLFAVPRAGSPSSVDADPQPTERLSLACPRR
jgi:hypothetical protein